ncbi:electron transfer flavoprotein subunit alpha/FixB family protein [Cupriavidus neocaledonicus]|uniref:Electron transfer flavoprotein alpha subunit apoprotein n=1 Tax=Cupriavidus neocaledonicus TaxID=1040979 RepID=A0A375H3M9_9BURK|nr:electron transfer flavoprotein subunit alpha/FixB family protein [Cupriavidus neocaledonicus]SOZ34801.1 Electron transfer flavoprotein beta-subunit:Electron transfer flavoprotein, alpha subunit [Cupriavidus neocaledonicus]SPD46834.1 Electron transfer flavoprotein alpha subunit apoprotein [Cupriavidus neocaledonicus]
MDKIKRIDPRRPFIITAAGLRRITLGETGSADAHAAHWPAHGHGAAAKPRRMVSDPRHVMLVAAHSERGALDDHARQAVAAAALLADAQTEVALLVFGEMKDDAAELGADKLIALPEFDRRTFAPEAELRALQACATALSARHVFMPDNAAADGDLGRRYAAAAAGASVATHVVEIDARHVATYAHARRSFATRALPDVILLAPGAVDAKLPFTGAGERLSPDFLCARGSSTHPYRDLGIEEIDAARVALEEADFIVAAGNGVADIGAFEQLAGAFGAAIAASRVAVDNGHFSRDKQVGATGKTVEASVYIAFGISGAVQHLQGIKDCRHVIAVNVDASAPIARRANLTIVGDARETIAELIALVQAARPARGQPAPARPRELAGVAA